MLSVCPFFGARDELKQLSDYPKCPETRQCALWSEQHNACALLALADTLPRELGYHGTSLLTTLQEITTQLYAIANGNISTAVRQLTEQGANMADEIAKLTDTFKAIQVTNAHKEEHVDGTSKNK